ncbi:hypothetical protein Micbo1qcDRAFT_221433 [Microdochium bolleyi]|uniref:Uncharacterized protein n=1 Tax=Microdochium bolleyi TaxID=196109 RepID=A0A136ILG3_9PEZI|nr:hypothetical protein Micbo1qcDRAFT_221433 [Microdochium bolleyi]
MDSAEIMCVKTKYHGCPEPFDNALDQECLENQNKVVESCEWRPDSPEARVDEIGPHWIPVQESQTVHDAVEEPQKNLDAEADDVSPGTSPRVSNAIPMKLTPETPRKFSLRKKSPSKETSSGAAQENTEESAGCNGKSPVAKNPPPTHHVQPISEASKTSQDRSESHTQDPSEDVSNIPRDVLHHEPLESTTKVGPNPDSHSKTDSQTFGNTRPSIIQEKVRRAMSIARETIRPKHEQVAMDEPFGPSPPVSARADSLTVLLPEPEFDSREDQQPLRSQALFGLSEEEQARQQKKAAKHLEAARKAGARAAKQQARKDKKEQQEREKKEQEKQRKVRKEKEQGGTAS